MSSSSSSSSSAAAAAAGSESPQVVEDIGGLLRILSDGTILRSSDPPSVPVRDDGTVEWKEVVFEPTRGLRLRLYRPRDHHHDTKLPVLISFHGGGFCVGSCALPNFHNCCLRLSSELRALVVAPDYRLAPEHRLPAAIDDSVSAVGWLNAQATSPEPDPWLAAGADFGRVFISGDSAGGNIVHHLAVRFGPTDLGPVRIRGYVLLYPFFGGTQRTESEAKYGKEGPVLTLEGSDACWRISLPRGADRDHPLANPVGPRSAGLESARLGPMLVVAAGRDLLRDRDVEYARRLQGWGKPVELVELPGQTHGFFSIDTWSQGADDLMRIVKRFVDKYGGGPP